MKSGATGSSGTAHERVRPETELRGGGKDVVSGRAGGGSLAGRATTLGAGVRTGSGSDMTGMARNGGGADARNGGGGVDARNGGGAEARKGGGCGVRSGSTRAASARVGSLREGTGEMTTGAA